MTDVAAAAIRVATAGGVAAVSMRAVAAELGTTASTLYHYVASRDELLDLMVDTAMAGFVSEPQPGRDWLSELVRLAEATKSLYLDQPWILDARASTSAPGPNTWSWFEHCLDAMKDLDRPAAAKMEAIAMLAGIVMLFARNETAAVAYAFDAVDPARHPRLVSALTDPTVGQPAGDLFGRTVRAVLCGLVHDV